MYSSVVGALLCVSFLVSSGVSGIEEAGLVIVTPEPQEEGNLKESKDDSMNNTLWDILARSSVLESWAEAEEDVQEDQEDDVQEDPEEDVQEDPEEDVQEELEEKIPKVLEETSRNLTQQSASIEINNTPNEILSEEGMLDIEDSQEDNKQDIMIVTPEPQESFTAVSQNDLENHNIVQSKNQENVTSSIIKIQKEINATINEDIENEISPQMESYVILNDTIIGGMREQNLQEDAQGSVLGTTEYPRNVGEPTTEGLDQTQENVFSKSMFNVVTPQESDQEIQPVTTQESLITVSYSPEQINDLMNQTLRSIYPHLQAMYVTDPIDYVENNFEVIKPEDPGYTISGHLEPTIQQMSQNQEFLPPVRVEPQEYRPGGSHALTTANSIIYELEPTISPLIVPVVYVPPQVHEPNGVVPIENYQQNLKIFEPEQVDSNFNYQQRPDIKQMYNSQEVENKKGINFTWEDSQQERPRTSSLLSTYDKKNQTRYPMELMFKRLNHTFEGNEPHNSLFDELNKKHSSPHQNKNIETDKNRDSVSYQTVIVQRNVLPVRQVFDKMMSRREDQQGIKYTTIEEKKDREGYEMEQMNKNKENIRPQRRASNGTITQFGTKIQSNAEENRKISYLSVPRTDPVTRAPRIVRPQRRAMDRADRPEITKHVEGFAYFGREFRDMFEYRRAMRERNQERTPLNNKKQTQSEESHMQDNMNHQYQQDNDEEVGSSVSFFRQGNAYHFGRPERENVFSHNQNMNRLKNTEHKMVHHSMEQDQKDMHNESEERENQESTTVTYRQEYSTMHYERPILNNENIGHMQTENEKPDVDNYKEHEDDNKNRYNSPQFHTREVRHYGNNQIKFATNNVQNIRPVHHYKQNLPNPNSYKNVNYNDNSQEYDGGENKDEGYVEYNENVFDESKVMEQVHHNQKPKMQPTKIYIEKPYPVRVEKKVPFRIEVPVERPYPVFKEVKVPIKVMVERPVPVYISKPVPVFVEREVPVPVEKEIGVPIKKIVEIPKPYDVPVLVEKKVPVIVERKVPVPVAVQVERPYPVEVPRPYPVTVEKKVPLYLDTRIPVAVKVPEIVKVPVPVFVPKEDNKPVENVNTKQA